MPDKKESRSESKNKKKYHLVSAGDGYYCVSSKDMRTADASKINLNDQVNFKYGNNSKTGEVIFISREEKEVLKKMKAVKEEQRLTKEESFHEDRPRKSALKQRELMKDLQAGKSKQVSVKEELPVQSAAESKKSKQRKKDATQLIVETEMIGLKFEPVLVTSTDEIPSPSSDNVSLDSGSGSNGSSETSVSSNSSVEPKIKIDRTQNALDLKLLKGLEDDSDEQQTLIDDLASGTVVQPTKTESATDTSTVRGEKSPTEPPTSLGLPPTSPSLLPTSPAHCAAPEMTAVPSVSSESVKPSGVATTTKKRSLSTSSSSSSEEERKKRKHKKAKKSKKSKKKKSEKSSSKKLSSSDDEKEDRDENSNGGGGEDIFKNNTDNKEETKNMEQKGEKDNDEKDGGKNNNDVKDAGVKIDKDDKDKKKKKKSKKKKSKKRKVHKVIRRNMDIYPGKMFLHTVDTPNAVKVHEQFDVFIPKEILDRVISQSRSLPLLVKHLVQNVFTREALLGSTAQGYPNRVQGSKKLRQQDVLPRVDPDGREAILREEEKCRPRSKLKNVSQFFSQAVGDEKVQAAKYDRSSSSESSSDSSSSSS